MSDALYPVLEPLLRRAGEVILRADGARETGFQRKAGTANFVTESDVAVQESLIGALRAIFPGAGFISEEQENREEALSREACFILDPIDGTTNFIHYYRASVISLAMLSHGVPVFGAIYQPYTGELFHAETGKGAFLNDTPIQASATLPEDALIAFSSSPYWKDTMTEKNFSFVRELFLMGADIRCSGSSALDFAYLAAGRNDIYMALRLSPWDYAAAMVLLAEAGGVISDFDGNAPSLLHPTPVIASNRNCYERVLSIAKRYQV